MVPAYWHKSIHLNMSSWSQIRTSLYNLATHLDVAVKQPFSAVLHPAISEACWNSQDSSYNYPTLGFHRFTINDIPFLQLHIFQGSSHLNLLCLLFYKFIEILAPIHFVECTSTRICDCPVHGSNTGRIAIACIKAGSLCALDTKNQLNCTILSFTMLTGIPWSVLFSPIVEGIRLISFIILYTFVWCLYFCNQTLKASFSLRVWLWSYAFSVLLGRQATN